MKLLIALGYLVVAIASPLPNQSSKSPDVTTEDIAATDNQERVIGEKALITIKSILDNSQIENFLLDKQLSKEEILQIIRNIENIMNNDGLEVDNEYYYISLVDSEDDKNIQRTDPALENLHDEDEIIQSLDNVVSDRENSVLNIEDDSNQYDDSEQKEEPSGILWNPQVKENLKEHLNLNEIIDNHLLNEVLENDARDPGDVIDKYQQVRPLINVS